MTADSRRVGWIPNFAGIVTRRLPASRVIRERLGTGVVLERRVVGGAVARLGVMLVAIRAETGLFNVLLPRK